MRIKRQWGEWDDPSLQILHCTITTSSPKLTQIGEEAFSVSVDHVCQLQKVPFTPKMYLPNPKKREHPNWPKLSKSLSFAANNKYLQLCFSTSILIEQSTHLFLIASHAKVFSNPNLGRQQSYRCLYFDYDSCWIEPTPGLYISGNLSRTDRTFLSR